MATSQKFSSQSPSTFRTSLSWPLNVSIITKEYCSFQIHFFSLTFSKYGNKIYMKISTNYEVLDQWFFVNYIEKLHFGELHFVFSPVFTCTGRNSPTAHTKFSRNLSLIINPFNWYVFASFKMECMFSWEDITGSLVKIYDKIWWNIVILDGFCYCFLKNKLLQREAGQSALLYQSSLSFLTNSDFSKHFLPSPLWVH